MVIPEFHHRLTELEATILDFKAFCGKYDSFFDIEGELNNEFDISLISERDRNIVLSIIKDIKPTLHRVKMSYIQSAISNLTLDEFNELFEKSGDRKSVV